MTHAFWGRVDLPRRHYCLWNGACKVTAGWSEQYVFWQEASLLCLLAVCRGLFGRSSTQTQTRIVTAATLRQFPHVVTRYVWIIGNPVVMPSVPTYSRVTRAWGCINIHYTAFTMGYLCLIEWNDCGQDGIYHNRCIVYVGEACHERWRKEVNTSPSTAGGGRPWKKCISWKIKVRKLKVWDTKLNLKM